MSMEIATVKHFLILAITFLKTAILAIFYQHFGHKLRRKSGNPGTAVGYAVRRRKIIINPSDSRSKYFCEASDSESNCVIGKELSVCISQHKVFRERAYAIGGWGLCLIFYKNFITCAKDI